MNLIDAIRHHARVRPYDLAVLHPGGAAHYLQLAQAVSIVATRLRGEGVHPGMRAAIYVGDPFLHLVLMLAAMANGTISISAHPNNDPIPAAARIDIYLSDQTLGFAHGGRVVHVAPGWLAELSSAPQALPPSGAFRDPQELCRLFTSSGTTGTAKVVGHTVATLENMSVRGLAIEPITRGPNLSMMPLSTIGGYGTAQATLWHGATLVLASQPLQILRFINLYKVVALRASPQQLQSLVQIVRSHPVRFPSLERISVGGSSIPQALIVGARATLCTNLIGTYGSTEAGLIAEAPSAVLHAFPDAAGFVMPDAQVRIVDGEGRPLGFEQEGLVQVRTPQLAVGYLNDEAANAQSFCDGWFMPGDLGILRADGLLRVTGRADEMINAGGVKLSPALVDNFLLAQPGIGDAAAFAYRRPGHSDQVWAAVVCSTGFDENALLAAARAKLNSRAPTRIIRMDEIPRNSMGKPLRQQLSEQASKS